MFQQYALQFGTFGNIWRRSHRRAPSTGSTSSGLPDTLVRSLQKKEIRRIRPWELFDDPMRWNCRQHSRYHYDHWIKLHLYTRKTLLVMRFLPSPLSTDGNLRSRSIVLFGKVCDCFFLAKFKSLEICLIHIHWSDSSPHWWIWSIEASCRC